VDCQVKRTTSHGLDVGDHPFRVRDEDGRCGPPRRSCAAVDARYIGDEIIALSERAA
jgi:hypothetical protein